MSWALSSEVPLLLCVAVATSLLRLLPSTHQAPMKPTLSSTVQANPIIDAPVADNIAENSWRKQRRKRSRKRNTDWCRTRSDGHKDSIPGITIITLDRTNFRQLKTCQPCHCQLILKESSAKHIYARKTTDLRLVKIANSTRFATRSQNESSHALLAFLDT